jgi:hypothetical protein
MKPRNDSTFFPAPPEPGARRPDDLRPPPIPIDTKAILSGT